MNKINENEKDPKIIDLKLLLSCLLLLCCLSGVRPTTETDEENPTYSSSADEHTVRVSKMRKISFRIWTLRTRIRLYLKVLEQFTKSSLPWTLRSTLNMRKEDEMRRGGDERRGGVKMRKNDRFQQRIIDEEEEMNILWSTRRKWLEEMKKKRWGTGFFCERRVFCEDFLWGDEEEEMKWEEREFSV